MEAALPVDFRRAMRQRRGGKTVGFLQTGKPVMTLQQIISVNYGVGDIQRQSAAGKPAGVPFNIHAKY